MNQTTNTSQQVPGLNVQQPQPTGTTVNVTQNAQPASQFKSVKKNPFTPKVIIGLIILALVVIGAIAGFYLTQINQDVRQQAYEEDVSGPSINTPSPVPNPTPLGIGTGTQHNCPSYSQSVCESDLHAGFCDWIPTTNSCVTISDNNDTGTTPGCNTCGCLSENSCKISQTCNWLDALDQCIPKVTPQPDSTTCDDFDGNPTGCGTFSAASPTYNCSYSNGQCNSTGSIPDLDPDNGTGGPTSCGSMSEFQCKLSSSCNWVDLLNQCIPQVTPAPTAPPGPGAPTSCGSMSETQCRNSNNCNWLDALNQCIPKVTPQPTAAPPGVVVPGATPTSCAAHNGSAAACFAAGCEYSFSTDTCNTDTPNPTTGCGQYNGSPMTCTNNGCLFNTSTLECYAPVNCVLYHGQSAACESHPECDYEGGYCQDADAGGPTLGNPGECRDINGNLTDAVCYACPGTTDPSGGCQQNPVTITQPGQVPNASTMGSRVNSCGIVQCDCKGTGAGSGYAIPLVFSSQVFTSNCSNQVSKYACVNGTCQATTGTGYGTMTQCQANCGVSTPPPTTPPGGTPVPTPPPTVPPVTYQCNSRCETDAQCQTSDNRFRCVDTNNGKRCRLNTNPTSSQCRPPQGPQCLSITMSNVNRPDSPVNTEPNVGEAVRFTCGQVAAATRYIFRIFGPTGEPVELESTGNVSEPFTILTTGPYSAQCQICTGQDDSTCLPFEEP